MGREDHRELRKVLSMSQDDTFIKDFRTMFGDAVLVDGSVHDCLMKKSEHMPIAE